MRAQSANQAVAAIGDLAAQLDELRRAFAGQLRKLSHLGELAQMLIDATLASPQPRVRAVVHQRQYQARRAVTMPSGPTATAVGTSATPYLRASSGRRDTSTVRTSRPAATSSRSSVWQSVQRGWVNCTTTSPTRPAAPSSARSTRSI